MLTAMGVQTEMLTDWSMVWGACTDLVSNPAKLIAVGLALLGVFVEPTSKGLKDSKEHTYINRK
jgi:phi LC3 family holin